MEFALITIGLLVGGAATYLFLRKNSAATPEYIELKASLNILTKQNRELNEELSQSEKEKRNAIKETAEMRGKLESHLEQLGEAKSRISALEQELKKSESSLKDSRQSETTATAKLNAQGDQVEELEKTIQSLRDKKTKHEQQIAAFKQSADDRVREHQGKVENLNQTIENFNNERMRLQKEREKEQIDQLERMKDTWKNHEDLVESKLKLICEKHHIPFIKQSEFPHKGNPDNVVQIKDEFVILDAKSPQGDNLENFPTYVKQQAEKLKKYANFDDVKKDLFLVVPSNTIGKVFDTYYHMADFRVFVVSLDALEPVLLSLKRIEEYEFADKLSPDDREQIVAFIGKMTHAVKRRVQVDQYFQKEFLALLMQDKILPDEFSTPSEKVEKTQKLNPPMERTSKIINQQTLVTENQQIAGMIEATGINLNNGFNKIEEIPLEKDDDKAS